VGYNYHVNMLKRRIFIYLFIRINCHLVTHNVIFPSIKIAGTIEILDYFKFHIHFIIVPQFLAVLLANVIHYKSEVNKKFAACYRKLQSHRHNKTCMECEKSLLAIRKIRDYCDLHRVLCSMVS
jgi:hypothetical protein